MPHEALSSQPGMPFPCAPSNPCLTIARMKATSLPAGFPGVSSPSPPPHKLELQTLKLEELTVSVGRTVQAAIPLGGGTQEANPAASAPSETREWGGV